ncbi:hypothetical protein [Pseudoalteromonas ostreae]|uniref:hypothetical protein n=1 Tax=Pseudoalteromonas ostreae TaxID=2774154 RepID=UPI001B368F27|nr:hypothetical protein [Pseudoalteromonas ostreae]
MNAELGSWEKRRVEGDVTGALTSDGSVKVRASAGHVLSDWVNSSDTSLCIGATHDVTEAVSVYSSYTDIFELQMLFDKNGDLLDPTVGKK